MASEQIRTSSGHGEGDSSPSDDPVLQRVLLGGLAVVPLIVWLVFVVWAGFVEHNSTSPAEVPQALLLVGVASGTALATIAGSFLGLKPEDMTYAEARRLPRLSVNAWATLAYFVGLLLAIAIWVFDSNRGYAADVIQTAFATLFGFGIGALKAATTPKD